MLRAIVISVLRLGDNIKMSKPPVLAPWIQQCCLFMTKMQEMQQASYLCDLTFELKNQKFKVHKLVLSAWSPLMYKLLGEGSGVPETIRVNYDNPEVFASFLSFLYSYRLDSVAQHNLIQILHLATSLQVPCLKQLCEEELKEQVDISNIISSFHLARKFRLPNLEEHVMDFMQMYLPEAVKQADFLGLSPTRFNSFLSSGWVCNMKPEVKLFLIISWLGYDVRERQQYLVLLLKHIDWSTVANDFLNEISQTENFFTNNESSLYLLLQTLFSSMIPLGPYVDIFPALRQKYAYLLDHIVQNSYAFPQDVDDFVPICFHLMDSSLPPLQYHQHRPPSSSSATGKDASVEAARLQNQGAEAVSSSTLVSSYSDMQELSNDSVTSRMQSVALVEAQQESCSISSKMILSGHTAPFVDGDSQCGSDGGRKCSELSGGPSSPESQFLHHTAAPSEVLEIAGQKRKGQEDLELKTNAKVSKAETGERGTKRKVNKSNKLGKAAAGDSLAIKTVTEKAKVIDRVKSDFPVLHTEGERTNTATGALGRPKRRAAANFSVPAKLIPRLRKTKALLKEVAVVAEAAESQEERLSGGADSEQENGVNDSDGEDDNSPRPHQDDSKKDPDFSAPRRKRRSAKVGRPVKKQKKLVGKSSHSRVQGEFTTVRSKVSGSVTQNGVDSKQGLKSEHEEGGEGKARDRKSVKKVNHWKWKCEDCSYAAPTELRLENHRERVHGSRATVYACALCSFECMWSKSFFEHMTQHFQGPPFACDFEGCGFKADRIQVLMIHRRRHVDERPYKCPQCASKFRTRNNLIAHFKSHEGYKHHECPVCQRRFKMKNTMQQHLVTHSDARPYLCDTCGFSTKFQSHLISHKRIHTGEVFSCNFINCNYSSPKRSQLKAHMRSHLNIRHHVCQVCDKSFVEKSHLVRHLKIHQDHRPHKCDQCEYSSTRIDKVNEHKRKYHSEEAIKSKRVYKYTPRGKNRSVKPVPKTEKKASGLPSSLTAPHAPILIPGRPIRPKKAKAVQVVPVPAKQSIEALVSAADIVEQSGADQLTSAVKGSGSASSHGCSQSMLREVLVKDEDLGESRLIMDLKDPQSEPVGKGKGSSGHEAKKAAATVPDGGWSNGGSSGIMQNSHSSNTMAHRMGYTPLPSHTSAALLQQLAASASQQHLPASELKLQLQQLAPSASQQHLNSSELKLQLSQHQLPTSASQHHILAPQQHVTLGPGTVLLPHTATPDVHSHILLSARGQHSAAAISAADVSAADSLASLYSGFGLPAGNPTSLPEAPTMGIAAQSVQYDYHQQAAVSNNLQQQQVYQQEPQVEHNVKMQVYYR